MNNCEFNKRKWKVKPTHYTVLLKVNCPATVMGQQHMMHVVSGLGSVSNFKPPPSTLCHFVGPSDVWERTFRLCSVK